MDIKSITIDQVEGRPQKKTVHSIEEAVSLVNSWSLAADYLKTKFTIVFSDGAEYEGSMLLHPGMETKNPLTLAREFLTYHASEDRGLGIQGDAEAFLKTYFA